MKKWGPIAFFVGAFFFPAFAVADTVDTGHQPLSTDTDTGVDRDTQTDSSEDAEEIETIENIETVQPLQSTGDSASQWTIPKVLGRLHPAAVHLPIGGIALALLFALLALRNDHGRAARLSVWFSVLAAAGAVLTGFLRSNEMEAAGANTDPINLHRNIMLLFVVTALLAAGAFWKARDKRFLYAGFVLTLVAFILVSIGGHLGGRIVYGGDYLPF